MLHNRLGKEDLLKQLQSETFSRKTLSFYRYVNIEDPQSFRNDIFRELSILGALGRIYIAKEGINAQMSIPEPHQEAFLFWLNSKDELRDMPIKWAVEEDQSSFIKLIVKVKHKIVADGLDDNTFDTTNVGTHLSAIEFHSLIGQENVVVVDMRNNYESEVGKFETAITPDAVTFKEELQMVTSLLKDEKDKKVLLYCTGGVRCEKASAYLKHHGFSDVNQLHGGIIEYARQVKLQGFTSKFIGKNFVFDGRMGERITDDVIAQCHQCGKPCDNHVNCANDQCHMLFIQCPECAQAYDNCCSNECKDYIHSPIATSQKIVFKGKKWRRYTGDVITLPSNT